MPEVEDVERTTTVRLRKLRYSGDLTEAFEDRTAGQPFGESVAGWPYQVLAVEYAARTAEAPHGTTVVTLKPYPVDEYMAWLERQRAAALAKAAAARGER